MGKYKKFMDLGEDIYDSCNCFVGLKLYSLSFSYS